MTELRDRLNAIKLRPRNTAADRIRATDYPPQTLAEVLGGSELRLDGLACWCVDTPMPSLIWPAGPGRSSDTRTAATAGGRAALATIDPAGTMIVDVETGGFSGAPVLLIGVLLPGDAARIVQFLARDFPEERAILRAFLDVAAERAVWVTFNGKSFDQPFLHDRMTIHRIPPCPPREHHDLLHLARRAWKGQVTNCRLVTLEREILGRTRGGDVPGREVPDLFHHFFRTGRAGALRPVLEHNRADLVTAFELLGRIASAALAGDP